MSLQSALGSVEVCVRSQRSNLVINAGFAKDNRENDILLRRVSVRGWNFAGRRKSPAKATFVLSARAAD
jgi:hypothetical protein